jgi:hypothetical protein
MKEARSKNFFCNLSEFKPRSRFQIVRFKIQKIRKT